MRLDPLPLLCLALTAALCGCGSSSSSKTTGSSAPPSPPPATVVVPNGPASGVWNPSGAGGGNQASEYFDWNTPAAETAGYTRLYQTFQIQQEASGAYLFPSSQWGLGDGDAFYFGIQLNGQYGKTALFSFFGDGSTSADSNCFAGADAGSGTSCHIPYTWQFGQPYTFAIQRDSTTATTETWSGWINDDSANETVGWAPTEIGTWTIPLSNGTAFPEGGFIEAFESPGGTSCSTLWKIDAQIGNPLAIQPSGEADRLGLADAYTNACASTFSWDYVTGSAFVGGSAVELVQGTAE
jgi:hypothetical protein